MIIIRTNHDIATHYLYHWSESIIKKGEEKGFNPTKIEGSDINKENVEKRIKSRRPRAIFFNGHGNASAFLDNDKKVFLDIKSAGLFAGTVAFARSCDSLKELGKEAFKNGCRAFIGYKRKFLVARQNEMESRPLQDPVAKPVLEASNLVATSLIKGKTAGEFVNASHEYSANAALSLIYSKEPFASASLRAVINNDGALGFEGDAEARIV